MGPAITTRAIVAHGPLAEDGWKLNEVSLRPLEEEELLVEIKASGICHTDLFFGGAKEGLSVFYPKIVGHEGSGYVQQVGSKVTVAQPGDPVLLSFTSCGQCHLCQTGHPAYCYSFGTNLFGKKTFRSATAAADVEPDITGCFFGQSSFAHLTVASQRSVVNVKGLVQDEEELKLFAPLGCGYQTGSGAIVNIANAGASDEVLILGLGGVGLSALMAAKMRGCKSIVAVDRFESRLALATSLGATHGINTAGMSLDELAAAVTAATSGLGPTVTFDTIGIKDMLAKAVDMTRHRGKIILVASTPADMTLDIPTFAFMSGGKQFVGAVEGDAEPWVYIPQMIQWYRDGRFPIDRLATFFKAEDFQQALDEMRSGSAIKPIITW